MFEGAILVKSFIIIFHEQAQGELNRRRGRNNNNKGS